MMPLQYIYTMALEQDAKNSSNAKHTAELLHQRCYQVLAAVPQYLELGQCKPV